MQKYVFSMIICFVLLVSFGCGAKKPNMTVDTSNNVVGGEFNLDETKTLLQDYLTATNTLNDSIYPNADSKAVGQAIKEYSTKMKEYSPKLQSLRANHADFLAHPPADVKQLVTDYEASGETLKSIFTKLVPYMQDPVVVEAIQHMQG
jgi:hypothetical protein